MAKSMNETEMAERATFIFRGTVLKPKATTIPTIPVTAKTIIVRVDEVLRAPDALSHFAGSEITVMLGRNESVKKGETAVFYTNSSLLGESLAVQSVGHVGGTVSARPSAIAEGMAASRLIEQVANANTVVTGTVVSVRVLEDDPVAGASAEHFQPISEHSPVWQEAVIKVSDVEKGESTPEQIVVRFPESTDVRWYETPKFRPGQEGVFILHKEATGRAAARKASEVYTALDAEAFQPLKHIESIRTLIKSSGK